MPTGSMRWCPLYPQVLSPRAETKLRTAERLVNLLSIYCILSWRIFWMHDAHMVLSPDVPPRLALTDLEMDLLDELVRTRPSAAAEQDARLLSN